MERRLLPAELEPMRFLRRVRKSQKLRRKH